MDQFRRTDLRFIEEVVRFYVTPEGGLEIVGQHGTIELDALEHQQLAAPGPRVAAALRSAEGDVMDEALFAMLEPGMDGRDYYVRKPGGEPYIARISRSDDASEGFPACLMVWPRLDFFDQTGLEVLALIPTLEELQAMERDLAEARIGNVGRVEAAGQQEERQEEDYQFRLMVDGHEAARCAMILRSHNAKRGEYLEVFDPLPAKGCELFWQYILASHGCRYKTPITIVAHDEMEGGRYAPLVATQAILEQVCPLGGVPALHIVFTERDSGEVL
jgi:hypothetical protein